MAFRPSEDFSSFYIKKGNRSGGGVSKSVRFKIFNRDGNKCLKCGDNKYLTIDHIVPYSVSKSNKQSNLQTLCFSCNQAKGDSLENVL